MLCSFASLLALHLYHLAHRISEIARGITSQFLIHFFYLGSYNAAHKKILGIKTSSGYSFTGVKARN